MNRLSVVRLGGMVLAASIAIGLLGVFIPKYRMFLRMRAELQQREKENRALKARVAELRANQERFLTDPAFVERTAREEGRVAPDEILFKTTNRPPPRD